MEKIRVKKNKLNILKTIALLLPLTLLSGCSNKEEPIDTVEKLKSDSFVIGVPSMTYCQEQAPAVFPNAKEFRAFSDMPSAYLALQQGKIDALIQDETMARVEISNGVDGVKLLLDEQLNIKTDIAIGISPESSIINESIINNCVTQILGSGVLDEMRQRWVVSADYEMPDITLPTGEVPTMKVASAGNLEPFSFYRNGELTGFDIEFSYRIASALGYKVTFELNPDFNTLISSTQSGKTDILISNLYITEERKEQMPLSIPYRSTYGVPVVRDNTNLGYTSLEELRYKKIGYDGTSVQFENQLKKYLPDATPAIFNNTADCVVALQSNRIDGFITDLPNGKFIEQTSEGIKILPEYMDKDDYGFVFQKNSSLTNQFNERITYYKSVNIIKELEDKWFSDLGHPNKEIPTQDSSISYIRTIRAATTALLEPMTYLNNKNEVIGFEVELLTMICNDLNYKLEIIDPFSSFGSVIAAVDTGQADLAFNTISITDERKASLDLTVPYYEGAAVVMVKNGVKPNRNFFESIGNSFYRTFVVEQRWKMILEGMLVTLVISLCSGVIGLLLGFGLCMIRRGKNKPLNGVVKVIVKLIQGTPIVVFLMIMYYVIFGKIDIPAVLVAILAFGINFGVYASEIMRSGFEGTDKGQEEAARAMGYSKMQTFWKITFPQAAKKFLPVLRGEFISMVKMTSVAGYISVMELTRIGDIIRSKTMEAFFPLIVIALIYFGLAELLTFGLTKLEKQLDAKNKPFKLKGEKKHG